MILVDTCVLLWVAAEPARLSKTARELLSEHRGRLMVSAISAFEIGIKHRKGKLELPLSPEEWYSRAIDFHGLDEVPVSGVIAIRSTGLPALHADPADRIIIATAQHRNLTLLTPDELIHSYPDLQVVW